MPEEPLAEERNAPSSVKENEEKKGKTKPTKGKEKTSGSEQKVAHQPNTAKLVRVVVAISLVVLLITGAFILTRYVLLPTYQNYKIRKELNKQIAPKNETPSKPKKKKTEMGIVYEIKDVTVNTFGSDGRRFAVLEIALETHEPNVINELKSRDPQIRDLLIKYLRTRTAEQMLDIDFQESSRRELTEQINQRLSTGKVDSLYFTMLVVQ